jgi:hypothetical protein
MMVTWYRASPDGKHLLVEALSGEFSRSVLLSRFATDVLVPPAPRAPARARSSS